MPYEGCGLKRGCSLTEGDSAVNDHQQPWYDRNGEPKRRRCGPGDERREPRRPSRPENPGQGAPRPRSGAPSQDANQFASAPKSGGLL